MNEIKDLDLIKKYSVKNEAQNNKINHFVSHKAKIILIISFIFLIIIIALILLYFLVIKKINNKNNIFLNNNIDNNSKKDNDNTIDNNYEENYNNYSFNHTINKTKDKNNEDNNSNYTEIYTTINEYTNNSITTGTIVDNIKIKNCINSDEDIEYIIIPTAYTFLKNIKYKMRGYYIEMENDCQVFVIAGGKQILLEIKEIIIEKGKAVVYVTEKFDYHRYILPRYGYTKIKFNRNPESIIIKNYSGKLFNRLE